MMERFLALSALARGGSGGASSWNDLKDKPFGEESTEVLYDYSKDGETTIALALGEIYTVVLNDQTYVCEAKDSEYGVYIGDDFLWMGEGEQGELPFCYGMGYADFTCEVQTFIISGKVYTRVPEAFLPVATEYSRGVISFNDLVKYNSKEIWLEINKTTMEDYFKIFDSAYKSNCTIICLLSDGNCIMAEHAIVGGFTYGKDEYGYIVFGIPYMDDYLGNTMWLKFQGEGMDALLVDCYLGYRDVIVPSSTPNSTKKFKITVDDSGVISATEV